MKNNILYAILGFNVGIIATVIFLQLSSQLETGSSVINYLIALAAGGLLGGIGYFVGGKVS